MGDEVWWERAAGPDRHGGVTSGPGPTGQQPELVTATREQVRADLSARIPAYTPDWTNPDPSDAGVALVRLFGALAEPVLTRLNRLPEKLLTEHLATAGVGPLPATPAGALLRFTVTRLDGASVAIPAGFQVSAAPATGSGDRVVFETRRDLTATPATIAAVAVDDAGRLTPVVGATTGRGDPFAAFGERPRPGNALWIGLSGPAAPYPSISLGLAVATAAGDPAPASSGADTPASAQAPLLRWDVLDGARFVPARVAADGTGGLRGSGVVELRLPAGWAPARPPGSRPLPVLRWLRVMVASGDFTTPPRLTAVLPNMVPATAVRTIRDEVPQPVTGERADGRTRLRLSQVPVVPGSVRLSVRDDVAAGVFGTVAPAATTWREVASLAGHSPADRVFTVDYATGVLTFGDGMHGAQVPQGLRNVVVDSYQAGGGAAGAVAAGEISSLVTSLPFVTGVTNPYPAEGGVDAEPDAAALRDGPALLRAGGRAVTTDDYALLARQTPGAQVARAHAMTGLDPARPGVPVPGVVGVLVVPAVPDTDSPPVPDAGTLRAVADYLAGTLAPAGVRVVAGAPSYQRVTVRALVVPDPDADRSDLLIRASDALYEYLHPVRGGPDGTGWPFGGALRYVPLLRRLAAVPGVLAVPRLSLTVAGLAVPACTDHPLRAGVLPWPARPVLIPVDPTSSTGEGS